MTSLERIEMTDKQKNWSNTHVPKYIHHNTASAKCDFFLLVYNILITSTITRQMMISRCNKIFGGVSKLPSLDTDIGIWLFYGCSRRRRPLPPFSPFLYTLQPSKNQKSWKYRFTKRVKKSLWFYTKAHKWHLIFNNSSASKRRHYNVQTTSL